MSELEPEKVTVFDVVDVFAPLPTVSLTSTVLENPVLDDAVCDDADALGELPPPPGDAELIAASCAIPDAAI